MHRQSLALTSPMAAMQEPHLIDTSAHKKRLICITKSWHQRAADGTTCMTVVMAYSLELLSVLLPAVKKPRVAINLSASASGLLVLLSASSGGVALTFTQNDTPTKMLLTI